MKMKIENDGIQRVDNFINFADANHNKKYLYIKEK